MSWVYFCSETIILEVRIYKTILAHDESLRGCSMPQCCVLLAYGNIKYSTQVQHNQVQNFGKTVLKIYLHFAVYGAFTFKNIIAIDSAVLFISKLMFKHHFLVYPSPKCLMVHCEHSS